MITTILISILMYLCFGGLFYEALMMVARNKATEMPEDDDIHGLIEGTSNNTTRVISMAIWPLLICVIMFYAIGGE